MERGTKTTKAMNYENNNNLVRIDKNIANNSEALAVDFKNDDELVTSILMFAAWQRKNSLFNEGIIDPREFAKKVGFTEKYLTTVHPNPAYFRGWSKEKIEEAYHEQALHPEDPAFRVPDSRLENALFLLVSQNITFRRKGKTFISQKNGTMQESIITGARLMKSFSVIFQQSLRGKKKLLYSYELDEGFSQNLSLFYVKADIEDFATFRKLNLHRLYLYIKNLRETAICNKEPKYSLDFDLLCKIGDINSTNARDKKVRLNQAINKISQVIDITLDWKKRSPNERWKYLPVLTFNEVEKMKITSSLPFDKTDPVGEKIDIFFENFMLNVIRTYKDEFGYDIALEKDIALVEDIVIRYLKDKSKDTIFSWYASAQQHTFTKVGFKTTEQFEKFYRELPHLETYTSIKEFIALLFTSFTETKQISGKPETIEDLRAEYGNVHFVEAAVTDSFIDSQKKLGIKIINLNGKFYACSNPVK